MSDHLSGYGALHERIRETEKAVLFRYHNKQVWVPKSLLINHNGVEYAPTYVTQKAFHIPTSDRARQT